jgi:hypothetical protein
VADLLKKELGSVEVQMKPGSFGEFRVVVAGRTIARKRWFRFPTDEAILAAVRQALAA